MKILLIFSLSLLLGFSSLGIQAVTDQQIVNANQTPVQWLTHGRTYDEKRFSPLDQINQRTVRRLGLTWSYATGNRRGMEATPIVADGVMYITTAWSRVAALDAKSGKLLWVFDPEVPGAKARDACCDVVNRGLAIWGNKVFLGALDGRLIALNKDTGAVVWSKQTTEVGKPYTITGAPRIVKGKVIIGNGGAEFGVRGYFSAYAVETGEMVWRFYTVPTQFQESDESQHISMARDTWSPDSLWETGLGGTVWDSFAYDPELNLLYVGVGNAAQYNRAQRSPGGGDNLFVASILAVNADTGELIWHYQTTPAESWDYTATQHMILADISILGRQRKVLMQAPKNGFFYVLDRTTGELISAKNYVPVNWASHIDPETGRPVETGLGDWSQIQRMISPSIVGGHNWHPMSYSEATGLVYIPTIHSVYAFKANTEYEFNPETFNTGEDFAGLMATSPDTMPRFCSPTRLTAWDPVKQKQVWQVKFSRGISAGILSTGGGLVFQGATDGKLNAYRDADGALLWSQQVNVGIMAPPVSYEVDGVQYIAVVAGLGGSQGGHQDEFDNVNAGHVFAFRLDGIFPAPDIAPRVTRVDIVESSLGMDEVGRGADLFAVHCLRCHGVFAKSSGLYPDLRFSTKDVHSAWQAIVLGGMLADKGMASFSDSLDANDVTAIHSYVISQAIRSEQLGQRLIKGVVDRICIPAEWLAE